MADVEFSHWPNSWLSGLIQTVENVEKGGYASHANRRIAQGELLAMWGGTIVTAEQLPSLPDRLRQLSIQVEESLYLVTMVVGGGDYINHSCDPNAGLYGQIGLVALRDIEAGEEICFDYAMSDSSDYDEFECGCGASNCRGRVTGRDWQIPELWERYQGYFSPYIEKKIERTRLLHFNGTVR